MRKLRRLKTILNVLWFLSLVGMFGVTGSLYSDYISFNHALVQEIIFGIICLGSFIGARNTEKEIKNALQGRPSK